MATLTMTMFTTLDGVVQAPGGKGEDPSGGFAHEGWLVPYFDGDAGAFVVDIFGRADAFLLGRGTYEIFARHWPRVTGPNDPIAAALNGLPKFVASRTLEHADWAHSTIVRDVVSTIATLKGKYAHEIQVHGSPGLGRTLFASGLVDVLNLLTFPVVLGRGKRLFDGESTPAALNLEKSQTTGKGVVLSRYRRMGAPTYGSFMLEESNRSEA